MNMKNSNTQTVFMRKIATLFLLSAALILPMQTTEPSQSRTCVFETKEIFLTFDDGPTDSTTPYILDTLKKENVPATFFVIGRQIKGRENILKRIADDGHAIGIHSFSHKYAEIYSNEKTLLTDIEKCREAIRSVLPGFDGNLYRFPGGSFMCPQLRECVKSAGYRYYDWNAALGDAEGNFTADQLFRNAVETSGDKNHIVLLLHDGVGYKETCKALPDIIRYFKTKSYQFKTL